MKRILVLGIGNLLWADEGFGVRVVQELDKAFDFPASVTLLDGGTQGLGLIPFIQESDTLIIVDAVDFQLAPGSLIQLRDEDVPALFGAKKMSLHQISFQEVLSICQLMGNSPAHLHLIGVQPEILEDYGGSLSPLLKSQMQAAMDAVIQILQSHGIQALYKAGVSHNTPANTMDMEQYERFRPSPQEACRVGDSRFL